MSAFDAPSAYSFALAARLQSELRQKLDPAAEIDTAARFQALRTIRERWNEHTNGLKDQFEPFAAQLQALEAKLAREHLDHLLAEYPGCKINTLAKLIQDRALREAVWSLVLAAREEAILTVMRDAVVAWSKPLDADARLGIALDERVIEVPLAVEVAQFAEPGTILDAGGSLNLPFLRPLIAQSAARIIHYGQSADREELCGMGDRASYLFGDLRAMEFKDGAFDRVLCISTLEHVGMDNRKYGAPSEKNPDSAFDAFREMLRVLSPGGRMLLTVPYGHPSDQGWFRVFGPDDIAALNAVAMGVICQARYFFYDAFWSEGTSAVQEPTSAMVREVEQNTGVAVLLFEKPIHEVAGVD